MHHFKNQAYRLQSGYDMPSIGLGTWKLSGAVCEKIVPKAIEMGYRHIDTAELYENESQIGNAIRDFDRKSLFITSKVATDHLRHKQVLDACERSLEKLQTDYLDLYLVHWPNDDVPIAETLVAMQQLIEKGMVRSVGLSNFNVARIKQALSVSPVPICNLQIEYHPFTHRQQLPEFCRNENIAITAYSPLARGKVFDDATINKIAEKHDRSPAQISLKWLLQKGHIVIPKASSEEHLAENLQIMDLELSPDEMDSMDTLQHNERLIDTQYT